jgi:hypothetical protein
MLSRVGGRSAAHQTNVKKWANRQFKKAYSCSQALAHVIEDETEAAYRRSDALAKRRHLMDEWAAYCMSELL